MSFAAPFYCLFLHKIALEIVSFRNVEEEFINARDRTVIVFSVIFRCLLFKLFCYVSRYDINVNVLFLCSRSFYVKF